MEPLKLPQNPTPGDLAIGLVQVHECLEAARGEVRQNTNALVALKNQNDLMVPVFADMMKWSKRVRKFGLYVGGAAFTAWLTVVVQNQVNHNSVQQQASLAAADSKVAAVASTNAAKTLDNLVGGTSP